MTRSNTFKLILISVVFSLSLLIALPYIRIFVDSKLLRIDTQIGGYELIIPQKNEERVIDLKDFYKGKGFGESQKLIFKISEENLDSRKDALSSLVSVTEKRLDSIGVSDFELMTDNTDGFSVLIPEYESSDRIISMVLGSGKVDFKRVKTPGDWSQEKFVDFYTQVDRWESVGISGSDFVGFIYSNPPAAKSAVLQISFTTDGRAKFYEIAKENINLPIGIYINDNEYPYLMPVLSENILDDPSADPAVTGNFSQKDVSDINLQIKNPLPTKISFVENVKVAPIAGEDFFSTYLYAFLIGLIGISIFFVIKFGVFGSLYILSSVFSFPIYFALAKILPIPISLESFVSLILITGIISGITIIVFKEFKTGFSQGKPFDIVFYQFFGKEKEKIAIPSIFILIFSIAILIISSGVVRSFMTALSTLMLVIIYYYSLVLPTFLEAFGGQKK